MTNTQRHLHIDTTTTIESSILKQQIKDSGKLIKENGRSMPPGPISCYSCQAERTMRECSCNYNDAKRLELIKVEYTWKTCGICMRWRMNWTWVLKSQVVVIGCYATICWASFNLIHSTNNSVMNLVVYVGSRAAAGLLWQLCKRVKQYRWLPGRFMGKEDYYCSFDFFIAIARRNPICRMSLRSQRPLALIEDIGKI